MPYNILFCDASIQDLSPSWCCGFCCGGANNYQASLPLREIRLRRFGDVVVQDLTLVLSLRINQRVSDPLILTLILTLNA